MNAGIGRSARASSGGFIGFGIEEKQKELSVKL
jgi:hypothetical protein